MDSGPLLSKKYAGMTILVAHHSQIIRLWLSAAFRNMNSNITIKETSERDKCLNGAVKTQADILITSSSFLYSGDSAVSGLFSFVERYPFRVLINDDPVDSKILHIFNDVIEQTDNEKIILDKLERIVRAVNKGHERKTGEEELSFREKEVLRLVALGLTNKEIAARLFISSHTVITHRKNITARLGIKTIAGLTLYAVINKLVTPEDIRGKG